MMWGFITASYIRPLSIISSDYFNIVVDVGSIICISVVVFIFSYYKHLLTVLPRLFNPYKLILKVLNYARRHKYPERRSALTYWEEDIPSRIDLGMSKYGGPFTVEEVEDVKTFLRLLPIILFAGGCATGLLTDPWYKLMMKKGLFTNHRSEIISCYIVDWIVFGLGIPIYHFFLYPLFYNYIPTMLNRIRLGLVLMSISNCINAFAGDLLVCSSLTNTTCLLFHSELFNISSNGVWWITIPVTVYHLGLFLSIVTLFEFVFAQSPRPLCGLLFGFILMSSGLSASVGYGIYKVVSISFSNVHSWFCGKLSIMFIIFVYFILFYYISKRYKLRKRDDIVPIHLFAEEYFEKELRGQKRLSVERSLWEKRINMLQ